VEIAQARDVRIQRYLSYLGLAGALALAAYTVVLGVKIRRNWGKESTVAWTENPPLPGQPSFESYLNNVVHEEARFSGHRASLSYSGMRTSELPVLLSDIVRQLIEQLVRNSVEHGGRSPEQRVMAGKPDHLNVLVSVDQSDSAYYVLVEDDGEGLDIQEIVRRAADLGLISIQQANALPAKQEARIIFLPEFHDSNRPDSQAENDQSLYELRMLVSNVGGVFSIQNQVGHYCRFIVSFPKDKLPQDSQN
jgi:two-component system chemotaxis sensor kinase CheA